MRLKAFQGKKGELKVLFEGSDLPDFLGPGTEFMAFWLTETLSKVSS